MPQLLLKKFTTKQVLAAASCCLAGVSVGFITGYSSFVMPQLINDTSIDYDKDRDGHWLGEISTTQAGLFDQKNKFKNLT